MNNQYINNLAVVLFFIFV